MHRVETRRSGFTLVELLVALMVSAVVLLGARMIYESVADGAERVAGQARDDERAANGDHLLRMLTGHAEVAMSETETFGGDSTRATFTSWCDVPAGWQERCQVTVRVVADADGDATLDVEAGRSGVVHVRARGKRLALRYLTDARFGGRWTSTWPAALTAPAALGAMSESDTLILRVGGRG
jgi:prepilin-type N-terminal cleavage/methylation domain-containing protein